MTQAVFEGIGVRPREHEEGQITKMLEQYTSQFPSGFYLSLALGSMALSLYLRMRKREHDALFVGQWAPAFLLIGMYNKMVKLQGSD
jgi:hypothetical protein